MSERILLGFVREDGAIMIDDDLQDESRLWKIMLGWPSEDEVNWYKARGARIAKFKVTEIGGLEEFTPDH